MTMYLTYKEMKGTILKGTFAFNLTLLNKLLSYMCRPQSGSWDYVDTNKPVALCCGLYTSIDSRSFIVNISCSTDACIFCCTD